MHDFIAVAHVGSVLSVIGSKIYNLVFKILIGNMKIFSFCKYYSEAFINYFVKYQHKLERI